MKFNEDLNLRAPFSSKFRALFTKAPQILKLASKDAVFKFNRLLVDYKAAHRKFRYCAAVQRLKTIQKSP